MSRWFALALVAIAVAAVVPAAAEPAAGGGGGFFVGFSDDRPKQDGAAAVAPAVELGAGAFRFTLQWSPGTTALSSADATGLGRAVAAAAGLRIVLAVYGASGAAAPLDATARDQYCSYVGDALGRFPAIRDVVVWNEPNKRLFWNPQDDAPALYEALLARCHDVLHAAFPGVNVVGLALSSTGNDTAASTSPGAFIRGVGAAYRASGRSARILDTVGFHPYPANVAERPWAQHIGSTTIGQGDWNKLMYNLWRAFDGTGQPLPGAGAGLWYLEDGFQTGVPADKASLYTGTENVATLPDVAGGEPDSPPPAATSPAPDQVTQVLDSIRLAACQPNVGAYFNFLLADEPILTGWQSGATWADLTPKGSFAAFRRAIGLATAGGIDCGALKGGPPSADFMPPAPPTGLAAQLQPTPLAVALSWNATTDDSGGTVTYRVYRNGSWVGTTTATSWTNASVKSGTSYTYAVRGLDAAGNLGDASAAVRVTTPDQTPPSPPASLVAQPGTSPGRVELSWQPSSDDVGVASYEVARDGVVLATVTATAFTDTAVASATTYAYSVVALDAAGNRSAAATATATTGDVVAPTAVTGLAGTGADGPPRVTLAWQPATDDVGVGGYDVYRAGTVVGSTTAPSFLDPAVAPGTTYLYAVVARDAAGNAGPAATVSVAVPDATAPSVPTRPKATALSKPLRVSLTWTASKDNVRVAGYRVYRNGALVATATGTAWTDAAVAPRTKYTYAVAAIDDAGNASARSSSVTVTTPKS